MATKREAIDILREKLEAGERGGTDAQRALLIEFSDTLDLLATEYSDGRHEKLLRHCTRMAEEVGGIDECLTDRKASEAIVRWINTTYDNEETNRDYRSAIRVFAKRVTDDVDGIPESVDWVPTGTSRNYDTRPDPAKMFRWDDHILPMLDACENARDRALITLAWDAGPRGGELYDLRVGSISDHEYGLRISVQGKEGKRQVTLIPSVPYVNRWQSEHPARDDPDAYLWSRLSSPTRISKRMMAKALQSAARRADMTPPSKPTPTRMRKSSASYLASEGVSQAHLEDHHGWTRGSKAAARYISVFAEATDRALARAHGLDVPGPEREPTGPLICPRCDEKTPRERNSCMWCGQALDPETAAKHSDTDTEMLRFVASNPDLLDEINELGNLFEEYPGLRDEYID